MAAEGSSSVDVEMTDLTLRDFTMTRYQSVLTDDLEQPIPATRKVNAPLWLSNMYSDLCGDIARLGNILQDLMNRHEDPDTVAPGVVRAYNLLLQNQNTLFDKQAEDLRVAQRNEYHRFATVTTQFATEMRMAIEYAALDAKGKAEENGQNLVRAMSTMAESNAAQFGRVELWAVEQEKRMQEMERKLSRKELKQDQQAQVMNLKLEKERLRRKVLKDSAKATAREKAVLR